jgi:hypothetical protein
MSGPATVYLLCLATSAACALLLTRAYLRSKSPLLFWTALGFGLLALNNFLLAADMVWLPGVDLWIYRQGAALIAIGVLLYGFIKESQ